VAERLAEALLGVGDGLLGLFQVGARLVEQCRDAADAVLDALYSMIVRRTAF